MHQDTRLELARRIVEEGMSCFIWAKDAMSFAHTEPESITC